jgi:hypothetical protein
VPAIDDNAPVLAERDRFALEQPEGFGRLGRARGRGGSRGRAPRTHTPRSYADYYPVAGQRGGSRGRFRGSSYRSKFSHRNP